MTKLKEIFQKVKSYLIHVKNFLVARLQEPSTYVGLSAAISGAALLPVPYSYMALLVGALAAMKPNVKPAQ